MGRAGLAKLSRDHMLCFFLHTNQQSPDAAIFAQVFGSPLPVVIRCSNWSARLLPIGMPKWAISELLNYRTIGNMVIDWLIDWWSSFECWHFVNRLNSLHDVSYSWCGSESRSHHVRHRTLGTRNSRESWFGARCAVHICSIREQCSQPDIAPRRSHSFGNCHRIRSDKWASGNVLEPAK